jgi:7-cyano-7-deazaguanine synthase
MQLSVTHIVVNLWRFKPYQKAENGMCKAEIAKRGNELGVDFSQTWSCYVGGETHCGECGTCVERREAFLLAGISDPTNYLITSPLPPKPSAC